jgi:uncharacterized protein YecA (UPF0149 family)
MTPHTADRPKLRIFLDDRARRAGTLGYHEAQGFLFAVAHGPEAIEPFEWIPAIFDEQDPGFADDAQTTEILGELMQLYNEVNGAVSDDSASLLRRRRDEANGPAKAGPYVWTSCQNCFSFSSVILWPFWRSRLISISFKPPSRPAA